jgi:hypothetical protein
VIELARRKLEERGGAPIVGVSRECLEQSWTYENDIS